MTHLINKYYHGLNYHYGIENTLYAIGQKFWIIDGRNQIRKIIRKCDRCCRVDPATVEYKMGDLPKVRETKARPFLNVGIDYCGPFFIKEKKFRNRNKINV